MQKTATRSTSCRTNVETETLILSQVVHQVQEPACRPVGHLWPSAGKEILASSLLNGTRGRSRTCVFWVQSPTGMPATHGSCIGSGGRHAAIELSHSLQLGVPRTQRSRPPPFLESTLHPYP
jgi:hypothetical protein